MLTANKNVCPTNVHFFGQLYGTGTLLVCFFSFFNFFYKLDSIAQLFKSRIRTLLDELKTDFEKTLSQIKLAN
jgi:hypothetical protein